MDKKITTFILIFISFSVLLFSTPKPKQRIELIDSTKGLSSRFILSILKDKQGFMWFGSLSGLTKYDGYQWTNYRDKLLNPKINHSQVIVSMFEENNKILWLGARNSLIRFDRSKDEFQHYPIKLPDSPLSSFSQVSRIEGDPNNNNILWLQIINRLAIFNKANGKITYFGVQQDKTKLKNIEEISQFQIDLNGNIWIGTLNSLIKYNPQKDKIISFRSKSFKKPIPHYIFSVSKSKQNPDTLWIGYYGALEQINTITGKSTMIYPPFKDNKPAILTTIDSATTKNKIFFFTWKNGLYEYNLNSKILNHFIHNESIPDTLASNTISSLFQDESGTLWIGTGGGLNILEERKNLIEHINMKSEKQSGISNRLIYSIHESKKNKNTFWIGTADGLTVYDRSRNKFQIINLGYSNLIGPNHIVQCIESKNDPNLLWISTMGGGLFQYNISEKKKINFLPINKKKSSIGSSFILALFESKYKPGYLWIGTMDNGMDLLNYKTKEFRHFKHNNTEKNTISFGPVSNILESDTLPGVLWIGTIGGGINKFDIKTEKFINITHEPNNPDGLTGNMINKIYESPIDKGILWIGTTNGLNCFDIEKNIFKKHTLKKELEKFSINDIIIDQSGNLWLSTFQGLLKYNLQKGTILKLNADDGLLSNEVTALCYNQKGDILLGSLNGLNVFTPEKIKKNTFIPPIVITELDILNKPVKVGERYNKAVPILKESLLSTPKIILSYRDKVFSFKYSALNYYNSKKNKYAYKMEGFNDSWIDAGSSRTAMFTGLAPGEYTFRVRGTNNDGIWNKTGASIKVIITPPWWKTIWAYTAYLILILLIGFFLNRIQRRHLINKEKNLASIKEAELRAKAAEAQARAVEAENQRKTQELEKARELQLSMLPHQIPNIAELEIGVYMQTATEVGGDYYDFFNLPDKKKIIAFGDATGHGLNAGTMVSIIKGMLMSKNPGKDLSGFFSKCSDNLKKMHLGNLFMGLTLLKQEEKNWKIISAGMPPIHLFKEKDKSIETFIFKAPPLGAFSNYKYTSQSIILEKGDIVLLFSDGLPELFNENGEMFGFDSVKTCFKEAAIKGQNPNEIINTLRIAADDWKKLKMQGDDITFMVLKMR